jgi:hypothetical protein
MTTDWSEVDLLMVGAAVRACLHEDDPGPVLGWPAVAAAGRLLRDALGPPGGSDLAGQRTALTAAGDLYLCRATSGADGTGIIDVAMVLACAVLTDALGAGGRLDRVLSLFGEQSRDELTELLAPAAWVEIANDAYGTSAADDTTAVNLLARAIDAAEEAIAVHAGPDLLVNAGVMRFAGYDRGGDPADLTAALAAYERADRLGAHHALLVPNWALALKAAGQLTGDIDRLRRAASLSAAVLDRLPAGAPGRPAAVSALLDDS